MRIFLIAGLVASTFLSSAVHASVEMGHAQFTNAVAAQNSADFSRGEGRRGGGHAQDQDSARRTVGGDQDNAGRQNGWHQPTPQRQQPVERRADRSGSQDQSQPQWRDNRSDDQGGSVWGNDNRRKDDVITGEVQTDNRGRQDRNTRAQNWDDRYDNGFDRERGTWDRNDRGHDDRYGNGWNRDEGRWNDRGNDRDSSRRDDRGRNGHNNRNDRYDDRRNENHWDNNWRNDRRYDWRSHRSQYRDHYRRPGQYYASDRNHRYSRFSIGLSIGSGFYHQNYWLNDPWQYRLPPVHGAYRWVRYYDDVLLIDVRNGFVVDVINDFFW